jgi:peptide/nickel transport system substrate-binding protein
MFVNLMTLIQYDADLEPIPYLARSWEVSEDGTELTFHLRDDVFWHDGEPTTAYDVEFTYSRVVDPETGYNNRAFFANYGQEPGDVEVVDPYTIRFRLRPHAEFMDAWRTVPIMPRHLLEDVPPAELADHPFGQTCPVGNGPFRFVSHVVGERWTFEANPTFPEGLGGRPYLDRYVYRVIPEHATLLAELLTEGVDLYLAPDPDHADEVRDAEHLRFVSFPHRTIIFIGWNPRRPQFADSRVRRALTMGVDRRQMLEALRPGLGEVANTGVPPSHWAYNPAFADSLSYDPDRARALLEEAGWVDRDGDGVRENADGVRMEFTIKTNQNRERERIIQIMQNQLQQVGVSAQPLVMEMGTLYGQITSPDQRDFDGFILSWETEFRLDDTSLFHSRAVDGGLGFSAMQDPELDQYLDTLQLILDRDEAYPVWQAYQARQMELQPYTYIYFSDRLEGVNRRLQDVVLDSRGEWAGLREWWIPEELRRNGGGGGAP